MWPSRLGCPINPEIRWANRQRRLAHPTAFHMYDVSILVLTLNLRSPCLLWQFPVLLFFYLLCKLGICNCIGRSLCKMVWACFISCFSAWEYCCTFLCVKLPRLKRTNRGHIKDFQVSDSSCDEEGDSEIFSYNARRPMEVRRPPSRPWRDHRASHLRKSLRPRSHQIRVGISRDSVHSSRRNSIKHDNYINTVHGIRVTRTSKFVQKGLSFKGTVHRSRRWWRPWILTWDEK